MLISSRSDPHLYAPAPDGVAKVETLLGAPIPSAVSEQHKRHKDQQWDGKVTFDELGMAAIRSASDATYGSIDKLIAERRPMTEADRKAKEIAERRARVEAEERRQKAEAEERRRLAALAKEEREIEDRERRLAGDDEPDADADAGDDAGDDG